MNILVIDVGGTHVKILATGQDSPRKFVSGPTMTPEPMVAEIAQAAGLRRIQRVPVTTDIF